MTAEGHIANIVADPADASAWSAYRDWLVAHGEPRGEILRLELAGEPVPGWLYRDDEPLLSPRLYAQWHLWGLRWRRGFIATAKLLGAMDDPPTLETIAALFADPHIGLISALGISHPIAATVPLWQPLFEEARPSIRALDASSLGDEGANLAQLPNLEELELKDWSQYPNVERVVVDNQLERTRMFDASAHSRFAHPCLRSLKAGALSCPHALVGAPDVPALEHLEWNLYEGQDRLNPPLGFSVFTSPTSILNAPPPQLRELVCWGDAVDTPPHALTSAHVALLQSCAVLPQLRSLALYGVHLTDRVLIDLLAAAPAYRHLDVIKLHTDSNLVTPEIDLAAMRAELERALPNTRLEFHWDSLASAQRRARNPSPPRENPPTPDPKSRGPMGAWMSLRWR